MSISLSIVEDNRETRESMAKLLNAVPDLRCISTYPTGEAAVCGIPCDRPDVALVDINLPGMSGIDCVAKLKAQMPSLQVLMLTTYEQRDLIFNSLRVGASGYILKNVPFAEVVEAVHQVHAGGAPMSMQVARKVVDHFRDAPQPAADVGKLTSREHEILALLAKGYLYKQIGDKLSISYDTVRAHVRHIYEKLHVQSRTEATAKFLGGG